MIKIYELTATDIGELTINNRYDESTMNIVKEKGMAWTCNAIHMHSLSEEEKISWTYNCKCNRVMELPADSRLYKHDGGQWHLLLVGASEVKE